MTDKSRQTVSRYHLEALKENKNAYKSQCVSKLFLDLGSMDLRYLNEYFIETLGEELKHGKFIINQRIEVLLDRDHCIGHANFMTLQKDPSLTNLAQIFKQKIIPQLQEYFFDDWSKINMVLNANGMLRSNGIDKSVLFPNVAHESESYFEEQKTWEVVDDVFNSIESFTKIIKH
jgi:hypothetical protein